jgi:multidrug efflux system outer membrane protein
LILSRASSIVCGPWSVRRQLLGIALITGGLTTGCTVGPDYARPDLKDEIPAAYHAQPQAEVGPAEPAEAKPDSNPQNAMADSMLTTGIDRWWAEFGDDELDSLVVEALHYNFDLAQAAARVLESRALLTGSKAARWPTIEVGGSASRSKFTLAQFGGRGSVYNTLYSAVASARYELDLWGRLSRAEEAAFATLLASEQDQRTVRQTLIADVVRTWLEIRELECQLALNLRTIDTYEQTLVVIQERYQRGIAPSVDVYLTRQNLLSTRALQPQWEQQLAQACRRLELLVGRYPAGLLSRTAGDPAAECSVPSVLNPVPAGLPSTLLERRPDLLAAEARLHAATARIGEAKATLFPRITLTGEAGYRSVELDQLIQNSASIWSLIGNFTMPLLNWGQQISQIKAAEARTAQADAAYRGVILNAFREVEAALDQERLENERRQWLQGAVNAARRSLTLAQERYLRGLDNLLLTLDTQRRLYIAEIELINTERQWRAARVNLILALGGYWDETPETVTAINSDNQTGTEGHDPNVKTVALTETNPQETKELIPREVDRGVEP